MYHSAGFMTILTGVGGLEKAIVEEELKHPIADSTWGEMQKNDWMTPRGRIEALLDPGSFVETDGVVLSACTAFGMGPKRVLGDGVITGYGNVDGRRVFLFSHDYTVMGGALGRTFANKVLNIMRMADSEGGIIVGINHSGGARVQEGVDSLAAYGEIFKMNVRLKRKVPQVNAVMGSCSGGAVYSPALTGGLVFMVENSSHMFLTGPGVVSSVGMGNVSKDDLGSAALHSETTGIAYVIAKSDQALLQQMRRAISYLPSTRGNGFLTVNTTDVCDRLTPEVGTAVAQNFRAQYDIRFLIQTLIDHSGFPVESKGKSWISSPDFFEVHENYGSFVMGNGGTRFPSGIVVGFARMDRMPIGIVANQPKATTGGGLDVKSSIKGREFVDLCEMYGIPILTLVDVPGFIPGVEQERTGIIRYGAQFCESYVSSTVPKVTLVVRKAYGGAYDVMGSTHICDNVVNLALPWAQIAVMGPEGAVPLLYRRELEMAGEGRDRLRSQLVERYRDEVAAARKTEELGFVRIIEPQYARKEIINGFRSLMRQY